MGWAEPEGAEQAGPFETLAGHRLSRIIHVANSVWALSPHDARAFGIARRRPRLSNAPYARPSDPGLRYVDFLRAVLRPDMAGNCWIRWARPMAPGEADWVESRSSWLCCLWDTGASVVSAGSERGHRDLRSLERQSELWATHSLIITERVRRLHLYPLPNLTALYCCCMNTLNSFMHHLHRPEINAVADVDFNRAMARLGFGPDEANAIRRWLAGRNYASAAEAMEQVSRLGLSVGMSSDDRNETLRTVGHGRPGGYPVGKNP